MKLKVMLLRLEKEVGLSVGVIMAADEGVDIQDQVLCEGMFTTR
jgi:hypothetical protein